MTNVSFYACESYENRAAIRRALTGIIEDAGGFEALFAKGKKTVIKPNLVMRKPPEAGATTHPALIEELILILKKYTDDITLAECPGGLGSELMLENIYRGTGIAAVCERQGVPIARDRSAVLHSFSGGIAVKTLELLRVMDDAEVFINVGKLKSHALTTFTGCAKNLYGAIPGLTKVEYHARFSEVDRFSDLILDINRTLTPTLSILDAVVGMEGNGPTGGRARHIGGIVGSVNAYAADVLGAALIGVRQEEAPILCAAKRHGFLPEDIHFCGDDYTPYIRRDFLLADAQRFSILRQMPHLFGGRFKRFLEPRPVISKRCVGCGDCVRYCPKKAIELSDRGAKARAVIDEKRCIRCYCCQELCPQKAVDTKKNPLLKL